MLFNLLGLVASILGFVCWIIILIDAFRNSILKGFLCLLCFIYMIYFAFVEFKNDNKVLIILGWLFGGAIAGGLYQMNVYQMR